MDTIFFWMSKIVWLIIAPDSLFILLLLLSTIFLWKCSIQLAKYLLLWLSIFAVIVGLFPIGKWLVYPLESKYIEFQSKVHEHIDGIIVLSGSIKRDLAFMELARKYPLAKLVFTGGSGRMVSFKNESDVASELFKKQGIDTSRIVFERKSRNTWENAVFSEKLINPKDKERWLLITTAWHMPRSLGVFCRVGWNVIPYPVDFQATPDTLIKVNWNFAGNLTSLVFAVKEWIGLIVYKITDRSC